MRSRLLLALVSIVALAAVSGAPAGALATGDQRSAFAPREDADHTEHYFSMGDAAGTRLHADVLRPKGIADDAQTPVILTVSPYTNHNGSTTDTDLNGTGPNPRFYDFLDMSGALTKGYSFAYVDLPGFGGSGGCNDWGGVREQNAVRAAVEWAASQPWSNGKVALLGKSYDGWTGLMGVAQQPKGLAAVVSLEPVYSGYDYLWMNGVRRGGTWPLTLALFQAIDAKPGRPGDSPEYHANSAPQAWCYGVNIAGGTADDSEQGPYWQERDLGPTAYGKATPVFLTQGFLETNTKSDGAFRYFEDLSGSHNRAWFGQFDHARCWETNHSTSTPSGDGSRWQTGREGQICMDEIMRFLDEHLKGITPAVKDPAVSVQDNLARWRAENAWPPLDSRMYTTQLRTGTYTDSGSGHGLRPTANQGIWTVSEPLAHDVWMAGEPVISVGVAAVPNANLAANIYDIDPEGRATMVSRGVTILRGTGERSVTVNMYGQDWVLEAGHRIAVLVSSANTDEFQHVATRQQVTVRNAHISIPFLTFNRTEFLELDGTNPRYESYQAAATSLLDEAMLTEAEAPFTLPAPLR